MTSTFDDDAVAASSYRLSFRAMYAYAEAAALHCALRLRILDALPLAGDGTASAADVAATVEASARGVRVVLEALHASGALVREGDGFALQADTARDLSSDALRAELAEEIAWWSPVGQLVAALRSGGPVEHDGRTWDVLGRFEALFGAKAETPCYVQRVARSHMETQSLVAAGEIGLLETLARGPAPVSALAQATSTAAPALRVLLNTLTTLDVLERSDEEYDFSPIVRYLLDDRALPAFDAGLRIASAFWDALGQLHDAVLRDEPVFDLNEPQASARFYLDLARYNTAILPSYVGRIREFPAQVAAVRSLEGARLLDIGAGSGVWGGVFARAEQSLRVTFCDREEVLEHTRRNARRLRIAERAEFLPGDFFAVDFPPRAFDVAILGQICHTQHPANLPRLLRRVADALTYDGVLVLADFVIDENRGGPLEYLLFGIKEFVSTQGEVMTYSEYE